MSDTSYYLILMVLEIIGGVIGGSGAKNSGMTKTWSSIVGAIGAIIFGQLYLAAFGIGYDLPHFTAHFGGSAIGGTVLAAMVGKFKNRAAGSP
jgi:hypothetical protein